MELSELLALLCKHNVRRFKGKDYEIEFNSKPLPTEVPINTQDHTVTIPDPPNMPPDLRADDLMNADKILNWSAPPSPWDQPDPTPMPLTGETPEPTETPTA